MQVSAEIKDLVDNKESVEEYERKASFLLDGQETERRCGHHRAPHIHPEEEEKVEKTTKYFSDKDDDSNLQITVGDICNGDLVCVASIIH